MPKELTPEQLKKKWDRLHTHADCLDCTSRYLALQIQLTPSDWIVTKRGLGVLSPGCCVAILPEGVAPDASVNLDELWFGVYLEGGVDDKRKTFIKIAWFYTQDHLEEVLIHPEDQRLLNT